MAVANKGRPKVAADREKLEFLRSLHFTWNDVSAMMGVSKKTLQRRAQEWSIATYTTTTDADLDDLVRTYLHSSPLAGEAMLRDYLQSIQVYVQRERLRQSVHRVNGWTTSLNPGIHRRTHSVPGPNSLWHVDGNHKMIRWRLVVHGGINGFLRLITYLHCSNNN